MAKILSKINLSLVWIYKLTVFDSDYSSTKKNILGNYSYLLSLQDLT